MLLSRAKTNEKNEKRIQKVRVSWLTNSKTD